MIFKTPSDPAVVNRSINCYHTTIADLLVSYRHKRWGHIRAKCGQHSSEENGEKLWNAYLWWWYQYAPTSPTASVLGDGDRALRGIADCASGSTTVHLLGKNRDMADAERVYS